MSKPVHPSHSIKDDHYVTCLRKTFTSNLMKHMLHLRSWDIHEASEDPHCRTSSRAQPVPADWSFKERVSHIPRASWLVGYGILWFNPTPKDDGI